MDSNWCNHRKYLIFDYSFLSDLKGDLNRGYINYHLWGDLLLYAR